MKNQKKDIVCPNCNKSDTWREDNLFRPFCSERCKLIDLGEWASDTHRIPAEPVNPESVDPESGEEN